MALDTNTSILIKDLETTEEFRFLLPDNSIVKRIKEITGHTNIRIIDFDTDLCYDIDLSDAEEISGEDQLKVISYINKDIKKVEERGNDLRVINALLDTVCVANDIDYALYLEDKVRCLMDVYDSETLGRAIIANYYYEIDPFLYKYIDFEQLGEDSRQDYYISLIYDVAILKSSVVKME